MPYFQPDSAKHKRSANRKAKLHDTLSIFAVAFATLFAGWVALRP
jgi:hypothetical protein